jgi:hypothetical protein
MSAGTVSYSLSASMKKFWGLYSVFHVYGTSATDYSFRRRRLWPADIRDIEVQRISQGPPTRYVAWGGDSDYQTLQVNSRPGTAEVGQVLLVYGYEKPDSLVAGGEVTRLDQIWDEVIIVGATWRGWMDLGRPDRAEVARGSFGLMINDIQEERRLNAEDWGGKFEIDLESGSGARYYRDAGAA